MEDTPKAADEVSNMSLYTYDLFNFRRQSGGDALQTRIEWREAVVTVVNVGEPGW